MRVVPVDAPAAPRRPHLTLRLVRISSHKQSGNPPTPRIRPPQDQDTPVYP
jgi:hypothetical protein